MVGAAALGWGRMVRRGLMAASSKSSTMQSSKNFTIQSSRAVLIQSRTQWTKFRGFANEAQTKQTKAKPVQITYVEAGMRRFKPKTPSLRHTVLVDKRKLWRGRPIKELTKRIKKNAGRNNAGRITVRHRGGGAKKIYRFIDFKRNLLDTPGIIQRFEYDPNRTAFIALVAYPDNVLSYIIAAQGMKVGDVIEASKEKELPIKPGNAMPLNNMPIGTVFHNLELYPGRGAVFARAAGGSCTLLDKRGKPGYALVAISSKEQRYARLTCMGTIGEVSNPGHSMQKLGKAGRSRWLGRRPRVRGVAMNPVDHPMGGGEGKSSGGRDPCSPNGILAKGYKTVRKKRKNPMIVVPRGGIQKQ